MILFQILVKAKPVTFLVYCKIKLLVRLYSLFTTDEINRCLKTENMGAGSMASVQRM